MTHPRIKILLSALLTAGSLILPVAAQNFSVIGAVLTTDIRATIDGAEIPAYNVNGNMVIVGSDLRNYGFDVVYDNASRTTSVTYAGDRGTWSPIGGASHETGIGQKVMDVYSTDISVYVNGKKVDGYNVDGRMAFRFSELKVFGDYAYDNAARQTSLRLDENREFVAPSEDGKIAGMAYLTDRQFLVDGVTVGGIVEIDGEAYFPIELLAEYKNTTRRFYVREDDDGTLTLTAQNFFTGDSATWADKTVLSARPLGMTEASDLTFRLNDKTVGGKNVIRTLDGQYPMLRLSALGLDDNGGDIRWTPETRDNAKITLKTEEDVVGTALKPLIRESARETVIAIHNYLVNTMTYDPFVSRYGSLTPEQSKAVEDTQKAAEAKFPSLSTNYYLTSGYGVCENYADLFYEMCARAGIPCRNVSGAAGSGSHKWNQVYVDGKWQYVDCTWDDPVGWEEVLDDTYLLIDAEVLANTHYWRADDYPMAREYDPAWAQIDPNNIRTADEFRKCLVAQMYQKKKHIVLRLATWDAYGGTGCIRILNNWCWFGGGYNYETQCYEFDVEYWEE